MAECEIELCAILVATGHHWNQLHTVVAIDGHASKVKTRDCSVDHESVCNRRQPRDTDAIFCDTTEGVVVEGLKILDTSSRSFLDPGISWNT